jgi:hypothetical protein
VATVSGKRMRDELLRLGLAAFHHPECHEEQNPGWREETVLVSPQLCAALGLSWTCGGGEHADAEPGVCQCARGAAIGVADASPQDFWRLLEPAFALYHQIERWRVGAEERRLLHALRVRGAAAQCFSFTPDQVVTAIAELRSPLEAHLRRLIRKQRCMRVNHVLVLEPRAAEGDGTLLPTFQLRQWDKGRCCWTRINAEGAADDDAAPRQDNVSAQ